MNILVVTSLPSKTRSWSDYVHYHYLNPDLEVVFAWDRMFNTDEMLTVDWDELDPIDRWGTTVNG